MLAGLGIDIVEVARMERELQGEDAGVCDALFTTGEIEHAARARSAASQLSRCLAAKEALFKALGLGWQGGLAWHGVELDDDDHGCPRLTLSGEVRLAADRLGVRRLLVSVSHTERLAMASVVLET
jgi:holo-[acyl-carrier protein] synthase